jgi:LysM repeat protein
VKGSNDNTAAKLAVLYYNNGDANHANRITEMNTSYGPVGTTFNVGTVVEIPTYPALNWYTVTGKNKDQYSTALAAKFGLSVAQLQALNPSLTYPVKVGTKVRTQ